MVMTDKYLMERDKGRFIYMYLSVSIYVYLAWYMIMTAKCERLSANRQRDHDRLYKETKIMPGRLFCMERVEHC